MPLRHTDKGWFWGSKGPFDTKDKALAVARAAYAHGYKESEGDEMNPAIAEFIATLLHSATVTHFMHLQTEGEGSYARHTALGAYYDGIVELVDGLAESIQGAYDEIIKPYPPMFGNYEGDALTYIRTLRDYVREKRADMPEDSEIQNEIDAIATLLNTTCYKLTRLR